MKGVGKYCSYGEKQMRGFFLSHSHKSRITFSQLPLCWSDGEFILFALSSAREPGEDARPSVGWFTAINDPSRVFFFVCENSHSIKSQLYYLKPLFVQSSSCRPRSPSFSTRRSYPSEALSFRIFREEGKLIGLIPIHQRALQKRKGKKRKKRQSRPSKSELCNENAIWWPFDSKH